MSADATVQQAITRFTDQLTDQAGVYREVLALSEQQQAALDRNELDTFHSLLQQKAGMMERIAALDVAMADDRNVWTVHRDTLPEATQESLKSVVDELRQLLERLVAIEQECEVKLAQAKRNVQQELNQIGQSKAALDSYNPSTGTEQTSRFLDLGG